MISYIELHILAWVRIRSAVRRTTFRCVSVSKTMQLMSAAAHRNSPPVTLEATFPFTTAMARFRHRDLDRFFDSRLDFSTLLLVALNIFLAGIKFISPFEFCDLSSIIQT